VNGHDLFAFHPVLANPIFWWEEAELFEAVEVTVVAFLGQSPDPILEGFVLVEEQVIPNAVESLLPVVR
jgi:hypothetical protein